MIKLINKLSLIVLLFVLPFGLCAQDEIRPVCDEIVHLPYAFNYNGFIMMDETGGVRLVEDLQLRIDISEDTPQGQVIFSEEHSSAFSKEGFFSLQIGSINSVEFNEVIDKFNNGQAIDYYFDVYLKGNPTDKYLGSKKLTTVPYSFVANALGGLGKLGPRGDQGIRGPEGPQGSWGPSGPSGTDGISCWEGDFNGDGVLNAADCQGLPGVDGIRVMPMQATPPINSNIYVDDGTNTTSGEPRLLYKLNGTWIEL